MASTGSSVCEPLKLLISPSPGTDRPASDRYARHSLLAYAVQRRQPRLHRVRPVLDIRGRHGHLDRERLDSSSSANRSRELDGFPGGLPMVMAAEGVVRVGRAVALALVLSSIGASC